MRPIYKVSPLAPEELRLAFPVVRMLDPSLTLDRWIAYADDCLALCEGGAKCAVLTARRRGIPVVATLRGAELRDIPELNYGSMGDPFFRRVAARCAPSVHHLTAPNSALADDAVRLLGVPAERVECLPNGIETEVEPKVPLAGGGGPLRLLAVGRLIPLKNHAPLVRSVTRLGADAARSRSSATARNARRSSGSSPRVAAPTSRSSPRWRRAHCSS